MSEEKRIPIPGLCPKCGRTIYYECPGPTDYGFCRCIENYPDDEHAGKRVTFYQHTGELFIDKNASETTVKQVVDEEGEKIKHIERQR